MSIEAMDPAQEFEAKLLTRLKPVHEVTELGTSDVQQFYRDTTVFLTGGSGFLGKQLIEKLLRATKVSKIFFLLRSKKGKIIQKRLTELLQDPVYDILLRVQQPDFAEKLVPVSGDVAELRLGLSDEDWDAITEQVEIVFHLAATTRFDESLRVATLINVRGTRKMLTLSKACKNLRSFVYVSTAYTHARTDLVNSTVYEQFYKKPVSPDVIISMAETVDEERINDITQGLIKNWPNTYTFAKSIAEELVNRIGNELPVCVVRPAIVYASKLEPNPGWNDKSCINGAIGVILAGCLGVIHTVIADGSSTAAIVPVDFVNNVTIAAGWETARKRAAGDNETNIYTVSPTARNPLTWDELHDIIATDGKNYATPMAVAYPFFWCTTNPILFWFYSWLFHLIPAYVADVVRVLLGNKRRFAKLATKLYNRTTVFSYFSCRMWNFDDQNTAALYNSLSKSDQIIFNFDMQNIDYKEYLLTVAIGLRNYILKDGLTGTVYARRKLKVLKVLTFIVIPLYFYCLYKILFFVLSLLTFYL